jgi:hypothetical protein
MVVAYSIKILQVYTYLGDNEPLAEMIEHVAVTISNWQYAIGKGNQLAMGNTQLAKVSQFPDVRLFLALSIAYCLLPIGLQLLQQNIFS